MVLKPEQRPAVWYRCVLPWAVFVIVAQNGIVIDAAPIARWVVGRPLKDFGKYLRLHHGSAKEMREEK